MLRSCILKRWKSESVDLKGKLERGVYGFVGHVFPSPVVMEENGLKRISCLLRAPWDHFSTPASSYPTSQESPPPHRAHPLRYAVEANHSSSASNKSIQLAKIQLPSTSSSSLGLLSECGFESRAQQRNTFQSSAMLFASFSIVRASPNIVRSEDVAWHPRCPRCASKVS